MVNAAATVIKDARFMGFLRWVSGFSTGSTALELMEATPFAHI